MHGNAQTQEQDFIQENERLQWELATLHAEVARLTQQLEAARGLLVEIDNQFAAEDFGKFGADVLDKVSAAVRLLEERERVTT